MTSDTLYILRDALIAQRDTPCLIAIPRNLLDQVETHLEFLKARYKETGSKEIMEEHESIVAVLEEIQELRADIIWNAVRFCDESFACDAEVGNLTEREKEIFEPLCRLSMKLRGMDI